MKGKVWRFREDILKRGGHRIMVRLDNGKCIIGFDNGYQFGKTARTLFGNGIHAMGKVEIGRAHV